MDDLRCCRGILCRALGIFSALQIDLNVTAATDAAIPLCSLTTLRLNGVVALAGFSKNRDFHVFEQTGFPVFEIGGFRGFDGENLARPVHFGERQSAGLLFHVDSCRRWRLFPVGDALPSALQIRSRRQEGQQQRYRCGPTGIPRCFASSHGFS